MSAIQKEIEKALGTKLGKKEERDEYLERLVDDSLCEDEGLSDEEFKKLSKPAQKWLNAGATALDKSKPVKDFPDVDEEEAEEETPAPKKGKKTAAKKGKKAPVVEEDDEEDEEEEETPAPKKGKKGAKAAPKKGKKAPVEEDDEDDEDDEPAPKKKAAAKKTAAKKPAEKKVKKPSAISRMQFFCCKHPKMDKEKIGAKVRKEGYEFSDATLSIQYGATHKIMNIIAELAGE